MHTHEYVKNRKNNESGFFKKKTEMVLSELLNQKEIDRIETVSFLSEIGEKMIVFTKLTFQTRFEPVFPTFLIK